MGNEFKLAVVHCTPDTDLCMRVDLSLDKKLWKIRTGPLGRWAFAGHGLLGLQAAGLLLAKPFQQGFSSQF